MGQKIALCIPNPSASICHAAKIFFEDVCGFSLAIVDAQVLDSDAIFIDYCSSKNQSPLFLERFPSVNNQFELDPSPSVDINGIKFPYPVSAQSMLPFDPIALTWLLMLLPHEQFNSCHYDAHHRPESSSSWLVKHHLHRYPLIDIAANLFINFIKQNFPNKVLADRMSRFEPTFDIDIAFAHKSKSLAIHGLGTALLMLKRDFEGVKNRINVWRNSKIDPFDVFDELLDVLEEHDLQGVFFAMTADRSKYDRNNHYQKPSYRSLIQRLSKKHIVGLHPGYASADSSKLLAMEKMRLEEILGTPVTHVRQHYLRQYLPQSWRHYVDNGLLHDYSIGYATHSGFKVGTCMPYQAFDLKNDLTLPLTLHPFALMDTAMWDYQSKTHAEVIESSRHYKNYQDAHCATISGVWHNYAMPRESLELEVFKQQISIFCGHD